MSLTRKAERAERKENRTHALSSNAPRLLELLIVNSKHIPLLMNGRDGCDDSDGRKNDEEGCVDDD